MDKQSLIDRFMQQLSQYLPSSVDQMQQDFQGCIKKALTQTFEKLDLVTREEFDIQVRVLERAQAKLRKLEEHIISLNASVKAKKDQE
jgi:BMFP domain-containing protein YqiC